MLTIFGSALLVGGPAVTDNPYILGALLFVGGVLILWNIKAIGRGSGPFIDLEGEAAGGVVKRRSASAFASPLRTLRH